jgi:hypothetical protein
MAAHRPQGSGAYGGDQPCIPQSLDKNGGGTAPPAEVTRRCTALTTVVYTRRTGASAHSAIPRPSLGGHRPRGGGATGQSGGATPEHFPLGLLSRSPP